ncbi:MAG: hypothetical protein CL696_13945 [Chloroflexi bacterium]|nr:hypothetical protein [Chloroflexota bacterium]MQG54518.1 HAMP domain-containing protein [SAR202 cluster bacterium]
MDNGNLSFRVEENTQDEIGTLAREFNRMSDSLKEKNNKLSRRTTIQSAVYP